MDYVSAPHHLWDESYSLTRDDWNKRAIFNFFSLFNSVFINRYPRFHHEELYVYSDFESIDCSLLSVPGCAPLLHSLLSFINPHSCIFLDLLVEKPEMRAFLQAVFQWIRDNQDPDFLPCYGANFPRSELFLDTHDRASSFLFHAERPLVETLVYFYQLRSPFYDETPDDAFDYDLLQALQMNLELEDASDYQIM